jgi:hypothetical protein
MQLLVSIAGPREARAALAGGADIIDAKDPRTGALGAVRPQVLRAVRSVVGAGRPVSAALGDGGPDALVERRARTAGGIGATFVKVGFWGVDAGARAERRAAAARHGAGELTRVVLVAYADWRRADSLEPAALVAVAAVSGAAGVLLDTAVKTAGLFELLEPGTVGEWIAAAHAAGLSAGLAGSLRGADFSVARALGADLVGVRGAACIGGRSGRVSAVRVSGLSALACPAPRVAPRVPALL